MKRNSQRLIRTILELEKPTVAAVNGVAAGMGARRREILRQGDRGAQAILR
jgi:hypothetical protein